MKYDSHTFSLNIVRVQSLSILMTVAQDVTETAKHDREVAAMANELRQLVDTANAPIFGIDLNGLVNEWNEKTAGKFTNLTKEESCIRYLRRLHI